MKKLALSVFLTALSSFASSNSISFDREGIGYNIHDQKNVHSLLIKPFVAQIIPAKTLWNLGLGYSYGREVISEKNYAVIPGVSASASIADGETNDVILFMLVPNIKFEMRTDVVGFYGQIGLPISYISHDGIESTENDSVIFSLNYNPSFGVRYFF